MKWVKFETDFASTGDLNRYLHTKNLMGPNKSDGHTHEPDIFVSPFYNDVIKNCYRIYRDTPNFESTYLDKPSPTNPKAEYFHQWHQETGLPKEYFDPRYFNVQHLNKKYDTYFKKCEAEYIKTNDKSVQLLPYNAATLYGDRNYPAPHPYEIYVGGWVHFFDEEVRCGDTDHAVYFKWEVEKKSVTIYILQTKPLRGLNVRVNVSVTNPPTSTDPPPPKTGQPGC